MKRFLPPILILLGLLLVITSATYFIYNQKIIQPDIARLPSQVAGLALSQTYTGKSAVDEIARMHQADFPLTSAAIGMYGNNNQVTVWVAGVPWGWMATRLVQAMEKSIAEEDTPFTPTGVLTIGKRPIYELEGLDQKHYYFQSDNLLVWLAVEHELSSQALSEIMEYYP